MIRNLNYKNLYAELYGVNGDYHTYIINRVDDTVASSYKVCEYVYDRLKNRESIEFLPEIINCRDTKLKVLELTEILRDNIS